MSLHSFTIFEVEGILNVSLKLFVFQMYGFYRGHLQIGSEALASVDYFRCLACLLTAFGARGYVTRRGKQLFRR
jgi:hypothetical protein